MPSEITEEVVHRCQIPPKTAHKFEVMEENTVAYEIYWTQLDTGDIVREIVGGDKHENKNF